MNNPHPKNTKAHALSGIDRRHFLRLLGAGTFVTGLKAALPLPAWAIQAAAGLRAFKPQTRYDLAIAYQPFTVDGKTGRATAINGTVPGPLVRWREGDRVRMNVTNKLMDTEHASIHWHGVLVPFRMDGVPGVNFNGIQPGETYEYEFQVKQAGTYWYHSHSAFQEQTGTYGPLIIDPKIKVGEPFEYDRDHVIVLSDWSFENPDDIFRNVHKIDGYYNFQMRTILDLFRDVRERGSDAVANWFAWDQMRMSPVDLLDVTGATYTYLMNGKSPDGNWTGLYEPGETVRLRFINASAMSNMDVRIPGLDMAVVMADGKAVKPVRVHEFRIGVAETFDVLVRPTGKKAYTIFAEALDRSGYSRGTLAPELGMQAPVPELRKRPVRDLKDIGMGMMADMLKAKITSKPMKMDGMNGGTPHDKAQRDMQSGEMGAHQSHAPNQDPDVPGPQGPTPFTPGGGNPNVAMVVTNPKLRLDQPGIGLGNNGWRVLTYADLVSAQPQPYLPNVDREMTINITANMERYMFSFDGKKFTEQPGPYLFNHNERLRLFLVNHTMMEHPVGIRKYAPDTEAKPQSNFSVQPIHDNRAFAFLRADRLENRWEPGYNAFLWDLDAWYGNDYNKAYLESEGELPYVQGLEQAQFQLLYNRTVSPFWDFQAGIRHDFLPGITNRTFAALGFQGLAPLRFEIDATLFVDTEGNVSVAGEAEYDFLLTQRLRLQPRIETEFAAQRVSEYNVGSSMTSVETGLRLRYQIWREYAPYIGVSHEASIFESKRFLEEEGEETKRTFIVAGVKLIL